MTQSKNNIAISKIDKLQSSEKMINALIKMSQNQGTKFKQI